MAAPVRFLSGRQQQQKIGIEGSTDNEKVLEVVGRVGIGTTIFEPDSELEVRGDIKVSGIVTANNISVTSGDVNIDQLNVTGIATFGNTIDSNGRIVGAATSNVIPFLYSNFTDLPSAATYHGAFAHVHSTGRAYYAHAGNWFELVNKESTGTVGTGTEKYNIGPVDLTTLDVSGISTFAGTADFNGDVDIDGHTELDNVNVSGVSTFAGAIDANGSLDVDGHTELDNVNISGVLTATTLNVTGGGLGGSQSNLTDLSVSGFSTFTGPIDANGNLDVDGHTELDDVNVSGITTTSGLLDINAGAQANTLKVEDLTDNHVVIAGTGGELEGDSNLTFNGTQLAVGVNLDVDGHTELDNVNVSGVSTFTGTIDANGSLDVDGHTELDDVNVSGASTFVGAIDANGSLDVDGHTELDNVNVSGTSTIATLSVQSSFDVYPVTATFHNNVHIDGNLSIGGTTTVIQTQDLKVFDKDIILGVSTDAQGNDISTDITANHAGVAVASTTGFPLVNLTIPGLEELPSTYKKIMWFRQGTFSGLGTDAWLINYAVGIGSTQFPSGTRLAAGQIQISEDTVNTPNLDATSAKVSDLTSGRVVTAGTGGELQDSSNFTFNGTTLAAPQFSGDGTNITGLNASQVAGAIEGITVREEGSIVGSANSVGSLNFVGSNILASASGVGATITLTDNPTFTNVSATNVSASSSITAATFYGDGSNIDNISVDNVIGAVSGVTIKDEGVVVGLANSTGSLNFVGPGVTATASGAGSTITIAGFVQDADGNLFAGNNAGGSYDPVTGTSESNIFLGQNSGTCIANGDCNIAIGRAAGCRVSTGSCNIFLGSHSGGGFTNKTGDNNIVMGSTTAFDMNSGGCNIILGLQAGRQVSGGSQNIFIGKESGCGGGSKSGLDNISLGTKSGSTFTSGNANVSIGKCSGGATTGSHNNMIGCGAGQCAAVTGSHNTFLGTYAGKCASGSGSKNNFIGLCAGFNNTGNSNTFIGDNVGIANTTGSCNNMIGVGAGRCATVTGQHNTFLGTYAGKCATGSGNYNNFIGFCAGLSNTTGDCNVFIGNHAGTANTTAQKNIMIGDGAGDCATVTNSSNIFLGSCAGKCATGASANNNFIGFCAGFSNDGGTDNNFFGRSVGVQNTTGSNNTFIGQTAGACNTTGNNNVFLGNSVGLANTTGSCNTMIGHGAGSKATVTGSHNTFLGTYAGKCASGSGGYNNFIGANAGYNNTTGGCNVFLGVCAGNTNTSGCCNVAIGYDVELPSATGNDQLAIGSGTNRWIAGDSGFNISVNGVTATGVVTATDFNSTSDAKLKTNVQAIPNPLDKIVRIDGVSFNWIENNKPSMGVIADNIEEVLPELVSDTDPKTVNYNGLIGLLIEVVKDQQTQINSLNERLSQLE